MGPPTPEQAPIAGPALEAQDLPLIRFGSANRLEEGDFVALEPDLYLPGFGGVRFENNYRVGRDGPELLTRFPLSFAVGPST